MRKYLLFILLVGFWGCEDTKTSEPEPELGKYQISSTGMVDGFNIYEVVINTKTGNVIRRNHIRSENYKTP